jgi:peptidylprolyl isomerase
MTRLMMGLLAATAFATTACADDSATAVSAKTAVESAAQTATTGETVQTIDPGTVKTAGFDAPDEAWRTPDAENLVYIDTAYGRMIVELYPEIAPAHVERIRLLASTGFYDGLKFHRVIDGFMNQTGDPLGNGTGDSGMADLPPEFTFRRGTDMPVTMVGAMRSEQGDVATGFYKSLPIATQPSSQAILTKDGKVKASGLHCKGVTSMARSSDPSTGNSQFFLMRGTSPWLDTQYSIWGKVIAGNHLVERIKLTEVDGQPIEGMEPDVMLKVQLASKLDEDKRVPVRVLDTQSDAFATYLEGLKVDGAYPNICDIDIPSRLD